MLQYLLELWNNHAQDDDNNIMMFFWRGAMLAMVALILCTNLLAPLLSCHAFSSPKRLLPSSQRNDKATALHAGRRTKGSSHRTSNRQKQYGHNKLSSATKKKVQKKGHGGLERFLRHYTNSSTTTKNTTTSSLWDVIVMVDANNVRGKTDFEWTHEDLLRRLHAWRPERVKLVCVLDHGGQPYAQSYHDQDMLLVWAGPDRTADDVMARASRWFSTTCRHEEQDDAQQQPSSLAVAVVTSDRELERRCRQGSRRPTVQSKHKKTKQQQPSTDFTLQVFSSFELVECLDNVNVNDTTQDNSSLCSAVEDDLSELEMNLRQYESQTKSTPNTNKNAHQLSRFDERTWHRVLMAEYFRRLVANDDDDSNCSSPLLPTCPILAQYQTFYQQEHTLTGTTKPTTMFLDHRICCEPYQQQQLLRYLDHSMIPDDDCDGTDATQLFQVDDSLANGGWKASHESCAAFARALVQRHRHDNNDASADDDSYCEAMIHEFHQQAPRHLQFSTRNSRLFMKELFSLLLLDKPTGGTVGDHWQVKDNTRNAVDPVMVALGTLVEEMWWSNQKI